MRSNPKQVRLRYSVWLFQRNPESYIYQECGQAFAHLVTGTEFHNTNTPGRKFVHWTIEEIYKEMADGKKVEDLLDRDWT